MTEILGQPELQVNWLVREGLSPRISSMTRKRGPYLRQPKPRALAAKKSNFVREWREYVELTQEALAEAAGLSVGSISAYELGTNAPSLDALQKLSDAMKVPKGMLLDINPNDDPSMWDAYLRATETQKREIGRIAGALIGPRKR
jgi:transcriptional regulator with XRE-family HTH domain